MTDNWAAFQQDFKVIIEIPVQWGEMDALQHVNNTTYFRYFESARIAYLARTSLFKKGESVYPVLAATECRYKKPLTFPDTIKVGSRVTEYHENGFLQTYGVYSCTQDVLTTIGTGRIVLLNPSTGQQVPLSTQLRNEIETLESASAT